MKIGIMLRHLRQHGGGVLVYTHNLLRELLALDSPHEFVLLYRDPSLLGSYADGERVRELALEAPSALVWDQWAVIQAEKKEKFDLIFNPKYSLPLLSKARTVFVCHGLDWYVMPQGSKWADRLNHRYLIPRYSHKADSIIAVSNTARQHVIQYLGAAPERVHTVYLGVEEIFRKPVPRELLDKTRQAYHLPEHFFLYVGQIYPPKNFGRLVQAYAKIGPQMGIPLVVAGKHTFLSEAEIALIDQMDLSNWVIQTGWVEHDILPAFYALADALALPSLYEACPSPILEAMAMSCPVVTSNRYGTQELAGDAAILVNPDSVDSIAEGLHRAVTDQALRRKMIEAGCRRVTGFSYRKSAQETLQVLENTFQPRRVS